MDVRFCMRAGTISREANVRSHRSGSDQQRALQRAKKTRAFPLTKTYMDGGDTTGTPRYVTLSTETNIDPDQFCRFNRRSSSANR